MPENLSPRYSLGEIISGILISVVGIIFVSAFFDVFIYGKTYNNYCCCNLETIYYPFNTSNNFENAFCVLYNLMETKIGELNHITKSQMDMTEKDFTWYLYKKNTTIYNSKFSVSLYVKSI